MLLRRSGLELGLEAKAWCHSFAKKSFDCFSRTLKFRVREQMLRNNSDTPKNFDEISEAIEHTNLSNESFVVWTDFERINMTHFRKISTD